MQGEDLLDKVEAGRGGKSAKSKGFGIEYSKEIIAPETAEKYLETYISPAKPLDDKAVETYAKVMAAGAWILNGQPIIFDTEGRLLDGRHRLEACKKAKTPFLTFVARNVRADTLHTIDQHRRRRYSGVLEARGVLDAESVVRTMSKLIRLENGLLGIRGGTISWARYDRVLDANPELDLAVRIAKHYNTSSIHSTARPVLAFMAIKAGKDQEIRAFLKATEKDSMAPLDSPPKMLSLHATMARQEKNPLDVDTVLAMSILAFNDFVAKRKVYTHYSWKPDYGTAVDKAGNVNRKQLQEVAPPNLGFPMVDGYPGLAEGHFDFAKDAQEFDGRLASDIRAGMSNDPGLEEIHMTTITPDMARNWLSRFNTSNRAIMQNHVEAIKRDILNEDWQVNAQPISFAGNPFSETSAEEPKLLNGQHRLMACVEADTEIEVPIAVNIPAEAFATFDIHAKKTRLSVSGDKPPVDDRVIAAAARLQWKKDNGIPFSTRKSPSATELMATIARHPDMVDGFGKARYMKDFASAGVLTWMFYHVRTDMAAYAEDFISGLETGANLGKGNPILSLRTELLSQRGARSRVDVLGVLLEGWEKYKKWRSRQDDAGKQADMDL